MNDILNKLHEAAASPRAQMDGYLAQGKKIVLCAPVYTPEELIHAMGFVPMGAWGGDVALNRAKEYCPAFLCAIVQSLLELGINGAYEGASAIVIPSLCDTLKTVGENWKYAVPSIPFIPMTYPQNRKPAYGVAYTKAGYERVIRDLEKLGGTPRCNTVPTSPNGPPSPPYPMICSYRWPPFCGMRSPPQTSSSPPARRPPTVPTP